MSGQSHTLATLSSVWKNLRYPLSRRLGRIQSRSGRFGDEKNIPTGIGTLSSNLLRVRQSVTLSSNTYSAAHPVYLVRENDSCHKTSRRMQALSAMNLPRRAQRYDKRDALNITKFLLSLQFYLSKFSLFSLRWQGCHTNFHNVTVHVFHCCSRLMHKVITVQPLH